MFPVSYCPSVPDTESWKLFLLVFFTSWYLWKLDLNTHGNKQKWLPGTVLVLPAYQGANAQPWTLLGIILDCCSTLTWKLYLRKSQKGIWPSYLMFISYLFSSPQRGAEHYGRQLPQKYCLSIMCTSVWAEDTGNETVLVRWENETQISYQTA